MGPLACALGAKGWGRRGACNGAGARVSGAGVSGPEPVDTRWSHSWAGCWGGGSRGRGCRPWWGRQVRGRRVSFLVLEGRFGCGVWGVGNTDRCQEEGRTEPLRGETPQGDKVLNGRREWGTRDPTDSRKGMQETARGTACGRQAGEEGRGGSSGRVPEGCCSEGT